MARRATCYRYWVLIVLSLVTFTNYLDRATVSVAVDEIKAEFNMNDIQMGFLLSQFVWGIVIVIPLIAYLLQRFGARSVGGYGVLGFSLMTLFTPFSTGFYSFAFFRLGLGAFEAPTFPVNSFFARKWFPRRDRAKAVSAYMAASFAGLAFAVPVLTWILGVFATWRAVFVFGGIVGIVVSIIWFLSIRSDDPSKSRFVSKEELEYIQSDSPDAKDNKVKARASFRDWVAVLTHRRLVGLYIGAFSTSTIVFFFISWFPNYLKSNLGFDLRSGALYLSSAPYIAGIFGMLFAGWLSDRLVKAGFTPGNARKVTVTVGLTGSIPLLFIPIMGGAPRWALFSLVIVVFFFAGMANTAWLLASEIATPRLLGLTTGVYGFWVNLFGASSPLVVGFILQFTGHNYGAVFTYLGIAALIGVIAYVFVIDKVESIPDRVKTKTNPA